MIEEIDDDTALEIAIIENLQREDLSPLDEALMFERMTGDHGYSVRKLAQKLGKDKGYIENRLRLADAPPEVQQLVSLRKDTLSHAYELLKVEDPRKRRRLAEQVARGELSLAKLRDRVEGRRSTRARRGDQGRGRRGAGGVDEATAAWTGVRPPRPLTDDSLVNAKAHLGEALEELVQVLEDPKALGEIGGVDRANLAKYLTDREAAAGERHRRRARGRAQELAAGPVGRANQPAASRPTATACSSQPTWRRGGRASRDRATPGGGDRAGREEQPRPGRTARGLNRTSPWRPRPGPARRRTPRPAAMRPRGRPAGQAHRPGQRITVHVDQAIGQRQGRPPQQGQRRQEREPRRQARPRAQPRERRHERQGHRVSQPRPAAPLQPHVIRQAQAIAQDGDQRASPRRSRRRRCPVQGRPRPRRRRPLPAAG